LYTKQHGVESNLFLAPGEAGGEAVDSQAVEAEPGTNGQTDSTLPEAIRLIRDREN